MNWENLKAGVAAIVKTNNNQEITGQNLQSTLNNIIDSIGANATFAGIAAPTTVPSTPDGPVFYIAGEHGQYSNFGNINFSEGHIGVFLWNNNSWRLNTFNIDLTGYVKQEEFDDAVASKIGYEEIDGMATENVASNQYIKYTSGSRATAGTAGQFTMRWYAVEEGMERIHCKLGSDGGTPAAIAFYSKEINPTKSGIGTYYMAAQSVQAIAGVNVYDVAIPADAKLIVVSNRGASLATPSITIFKNPFSSGSGIEDISEAIAAYDKDVIKTRSAAAVTSAISDSINVSSLPAGTQILIDVTALGGESKAVANMYNSEGIFNSIPIVGIGKFYVEVQPDTTSIVIRKEAADGNIINYTATRTHDYTLTERYQQGYYPRKQTFALGELFKGYYNPTADDSENAKYSTSTWVSYPINKTSGFTIRLNADFTTYHIQFNIWNAVLTGYTVRGISEQTDIDLRGVTAWNIAVRRVDRAAVTPESMEGVVSATFVSGRVFERPMMRYEVEEMIEESGGGGDYDDTAVKRTAGEGYAINPFAENTYYYHFAANGFIRDADGHAVIASQSLEDIAVAARLGFKFIEANIKPTSDGHFICTHGQAGSSGGTVFGPEFKSSDETVITTAALQDTPINSVTLAWIKQYARYNTYYEKYQTAPPTIEEFCQECKRYNIGIFAGVIGNETSTRICQSYMGNNMIVYGAPANIREFFNGYVFSWFNSSSSSADGIIAAAQTIGTPYMAGLGPTTITKLQNDGTLDTVIANLHDMGCLVGWAAVYQSEEEGLEFLERGMDFSGSGHEVNKFEHNYECYDIDNNGNQPTTTGTLANGVITLANGQTVTCGSSTRIALGKGFLEMRFDGTVKVAFGSKGTRTFTSDGSKTIVVSDYFLDRQTALTITATAATSITHFVYKTSTCSNAALPASTIWSGTQAQYDALTAAQKAAVIAFIEEEE